MKQARQLQAIRTKRPVTALAADPGFGEFGYGVVSHEAGSDRVLKVGTISTKPTKKKGRLECEDQFRRLRETGEVLYKIAVDYNVDVLVFESLSIPMQTSKQSAIKIGFPYGLLAMLAVAQDLPCVMMTPQAVKKGVCGVISASKEEVQAAVERTFFGSDELRAFADEVAESKRNHGYDALGIYLAAARTDVMRALRRGV